jgi:autotransporter strand-loop-strand O-heptosyltransferase
MSIYNNIEKIKNIVRPILFNYNNINGPFFEIVNSKYQNHVVTFRDTDTNQILHQGTIGSGHWISCNLKYFKNLQVEVTVDDNMWVNKIDYTNSKVLICIDSRSLGDNLAWMPYVEEFRKKLNCKVICSTFQNHFFEETYPEIEFVHPGSLVTGITAQFNIGWFYNSSGEVDYFRCPNNFRLQQMQKTASDILGLEFKEIKPKIKLTEKVRENIVSIAIHGTAQSKYWNNQTGWQEVVDYLNNLGYRVLLLSKEGNGYMGNYHPTGIEKVEEGPIENIIDILQRSKLFIGIGSGLSWLSWATNTPTCIISGFSFDYTEPSGDGIIRISTPKGKCSGCFNTHKLDAGDWNWCPEHKGTDRQFECSKSITSEMVIEKIKDLL